jgi:hypothetical protein
MDNIPEQSPEKMAALKERHAGAVKRPCQDCSACCDQFEIKEIEKEAGCACPFAKNGACGIYAEPTRPVACQTYTCLWVMGYGRKKDRPDRSGVIVDFREGMAGLGLYGHLTREPDGRALQTLERFSAETGLDVFLEKK